MSATHRIACLLAVLVAPGPLAVAAADPGPPARNVVLISIDALRTDHLPFHGYPRMTTPFLDRLVQEGRALDFHRMTAASSSCGPAHAALLTGQYPQRVGVPYGGEDLIARQADLQDRGSLQELVAYQERLQRSAAPLVRKKTDAVAGWLSLPGETQTLASVLAAHGWDTAGFVSHWTIAGRFGYGTGFAHYDDEGADYTGPDELRWLLRDTFQAHLRRAAAATAERALGFLTGRSDPRPFFLFLHLADLHEPLEPVAGAAFDKTTRSEVEPVWRARYTTKAYNRASRALDAGADHMLDRYDSLLLEADHIVERVFQALERTAQLDRTLVVVTADHGQAFGEHNHLRKGDGPYFDHGVEVWEETLAVPLLWIDPAAPADAARRDDNVSPVDVAPTVLAALGLRADGLPGRDLRSPVPDGEARRVYFSVFGAARVGLFRDLFFQPPHLAGFREGDLKLVIDGARFEDAEVGGVFLFQLGVDPGERNDISATEVYRPHAQRYRDELVRWYEESIAP